MCGIVGGVGADKNNILKALDLIKRRGPDATSVSDYEGIVLGHNRLSIIDLSEVANQPMVSADKRYVTVFNGEIYNYQDVRSEIGSSYPWQTHSDTETILAAYTLWGEKCLEKFKGMFSFIIWDRQEKSLFGARDRLGVKPFYYQHDNENFFFGSRPEAVVVASGKSDRKINRQSVRYFLEAGYIPAPLTIYNDLHKLPPGHQLTFKNNRVTVQKYWTLDAVTVDRSLEKADQATLLNQLESLVQDSVRLRMVSDVPVGVFLSGGIDSSLVAAMMSRLSQDKVKSFSIGFSDAEFDESHHANAVAKHLKTDHHFQRFEADDLLQFMPDFLSQYDEPFFDYSAFPVMAVSKMARQKVKVALSGDGGDEAFGGYHYYQLMQIVDQLQKTPYFLRKLGGAVLQYMPQHKLKLLAGLLAVQGRPQSFAFLRSVIKSHQQIFSADLLSSTSGLSELFEKKSQDFPHDLTGAELGMRLDTTFTLPDDYLQKVDVGSMAFSLEARDPLLDHRIFEWAARLPLKWKINGTNKYLLRELAYRYVPREILDRPKMGFGVPMAKWLRGPLKSWVEPFINDSQGLASLGLRPEYVQNIWRRHQASEIQAHTLIWSVAVLMAFRAERPGL